MEVGIEEVDRAREEVAFDAEGVEDAEFDVEAIGEVGAGVDGAAFVEGRADGVVGTEAVVFSGLVEVFDDCAVELTVRTEVDGYLFSSIQGP